MERLLDLGVDNLITNHPQEALELVREHDHLSPPERRCIKSGFGSPSKRPHWNRFPPPSPTG